MAEDIKSLAEQAREKALMPILQGAIAYSGNNLPTDRQHIISLFLSLKAADIAVPDNFRTRIYNNELYFDPKHGSSAAIASLFEELQYPALGVRWHQSQIESTSRFQMVDRYNLTADTYDSVLLDWSQNPEAIEFFERCGKYLSVEQNPIIPRLSEYTRVSRLAISRVDESESTS